MKFAALFLFFVPVIFGGTLEINGKTYTFEEVASQTQFKQEKTRTVYCNPFDKKQATIDLVIKKPVSGMIDSENFWFVSIPNPDIRFDLEKHVLPVYEMKIILMPLVKTTNGTMSFKVYTADGNSPGLTMEIFNAFISAIEKFRKLDWNTEAQVVIRLTGKLDLSGVFQYGVYTTKKSAQIEYGFLPEKVELFDR